MIKTLFGQSGVRSGARGQGARGDTTEILAEFKAQDAKKFGLNVRTGNGQQTVVGYDVNRDAIYVDRTKSGNVAFNATFPSVDSRL
jgi:fructan beta-fructosidase